MSGGIEIRNKGISVEEINRVIKAMPQTINRVSIAEVIYNIFDNYGLDDEAVWDVIELVMAARSGEVVVDKFDPDGKKVGDGVH